MSKNVWAVHDEPLWKGLSSNEFLRGRILKESPFFFFLTLFIIFFKFFWPTDLSSFFIKWVLCQLGFHLTTQWKGDGVLGYLIAGSI